jgi:transketolase
VTALHSQRGVLDPFVERRSAFATKAIRQQFGESMLALAAEFDFVAITPDLMYATGVAEFGAAYPERMLNLGIAEQNVTGVAAGLALCGKLPVVCGYAAFTSLRAVEQAKLDCAYNGVKVILVGQSAGLSYGVGGPTHQTFEDVAIMRAIPNTIVVVPSDAVEMHQALRACLKHEFSGPIFLRLGRGPEYVFNRADSPFELGRAVHLREGRDILMVANGPLVFEALLAAEALSAEGIEAGVLNIHTVKPIDRTAILQACDGVRGVIVAEEHSVHAGLGAAVLEVLDGGHSFPVRRVGVKDFFPPIGPSFELRADVGLSASNLFDEAMNLLGSALPRAKERPRVPHSPTTHE